MVNREDRILGRIFRSFLCVFKMFFGIFIFGILLMGVDWIENVCSRLVKIWFEFVLDWLGLGLVDIFGEELDWFVWGFRERIGVWGVVLLCR